MRLLCPFHWEDTLIKRLARSLHRHVAVKEWKPAAASLLEPAQSFGSHCPDERRPGTTRANSHQHQVRALAQLPTLMAERTADSAPSPQEEAKGQGQKDFLRLDPAAPPTWDCSCTMAASISELDSFRSRISWLSCLISSSFSSTAPGRNPVARSLQPRPAGGVSRGLGSRWN